MKKINQIKLSLEQGASEFCITRRTLTSRIRAAGVMPDGDGKFSIAQLASAIFTDGQRERAALTREQTAIARIKKENLLRKNIPVGLVEAVWLRTVKELRDRIQCGPIPAEVRNDLLRDLAGIGAAEYFAESAKVSDDDSEPEENFSAKNHD